MQTFPHRSGDIVASFEISNSFCPPRLLGRILSTVDGVASVKVRGFFGKFQHHVHVWFTYRGMPCAVIKPFGKSDRYLFEQVGGEERVDLGEVERAFHAYSLREDVKQWWHNRRSRHR